MLGGEKAYSRRGPIAAAFVASMDDSASGARHRLSAPASRSPQPGHRYRKRIDRRESVRDTLATLSSDGGGPVAPEHDLPLEEYHRAGREITNGNPEVYKRLYSRRDDVTLANPFGPPVRGWTEVSTTLDRAAQNYRDGEVVGFENVSTVITPDLAYTVEIESYRARVGGAEEIAPVAVRVTTIFRREAAFGRWRTGTPTRSPRPVRRSP